MEKQIKELYEAPVATAVEVKLENGILTTSDYYKHGYYEE